jgi:hypothetical protein
MPVLSTTFLGVAYRYTDGNPRPAGAAATEGDSAVVAAGAVHGDS